MASADKSTNIYTWDNKKKTKVIEKKILTERDFKTNDLSFKNNTYQKELEGTKFLLLLKLPPKSISVPELKKFLQTLVSVVRNDECLCFELDNKVVDILWRELKLQNKTSIGIVKAKSKGDKFVIEKEQKIRIKKEDDKVNKLAFSFFHTLIVTSNFSELQIKGSKDFLVCEITISQKEGDHDSKNEVSDEDESDSTKFESSDSPEESFSNVKREKEKMSTENNVENHQNVREKTKTKNNYTTKITIEHPHNKLKADISFHDACDYKKLQNTLYEALMNYSPEIKKDSKEAFTTRMFLGVLGKHMVLKDWEIEDIAAVVSLCINNYVTQFLDELLSQYKPSRSIKQYIEQLTPSNKLYEEIEHMFKNVEIYPNRHRSDIWINLFFDAVLESKFEAAIFYWTKTKNLIGTALLATFLLEKLKTKEKYQYQLKEIKKNKKMYKNFASEILTNCYHEDFVQTWNLLRRPIQGFNESCITTAMKTENREFTQHEACIKLNKLVWKTYQGDGFTYEAQDYDMSTTFRDEVFSPSGRCFMDMISYILFLTAYSVLIVSQLSSTQFHWLEVIIIIYIFSLVIKEYDQCCCSKHVEYNCNPFNLLDHFAIAAALIAWSLRWIAYVNPDNPRWMDASRYFYSFNFIFYMFRFLEFFYGYKTVGPILVMIKEMVKTYVPFLVILMIFLVSYAVASESLLYPEAQLNSETLYYVFRKGFWAMIGEYSLDELEATENDCTRDPNLYNNHTMLRCPSANGRFFIPILLGVYAIFIQILMFSLIIALLNNDVIQNEKQRDSICSFQKLQLTLEYATSRFLIPPFIVLAYCLSKCVGNPFISNVKDENDTLREFENSAAQHIIIKINDGSYAKDFSDSTKKAGSVEKIQNVVKEYLESQRGKRFESLASLRSQTQELTPEIMDFIQQIVHETTRVQNIESQRGQAQEYKCITCKGRKTNYDNTNVPYNVVRDEKVKRVDKTEITTQAIIEGRATVILPGTPEI